MKNGITDFCGYAQFQGICTHRRTYISALFVWAPCVLEGQSYCLIWMNSSMIPSGRSNKTDFYLDSQPCQLCWSTFFKNDPDLFSFFHVWPKEWRRLQCFLTSKSETLALLVAVFFWLISWRTRNYYCNEAFKDIVISNHYSVSWKWIFGIFKIRFSALFCTLKTRSWVQLSQTWTLKPHCWRLMDY